jgi:hypothetical protein
MADEPRAPGPLIRQLQGAVGGRSFRDGQNTVTFTAASNSAAKTVTHGLGRIPTQVQANGLSGANGVFYEVIAITSTTFDVIGWHPAGAISATYGFGWFASG